MESQRLFLVIALVVVGILLFKSWDEESRKLQQAQLNTKDSVASKIPGSENSQSPTAAINKKEAQAKGLPDISNVPEQTPSVAESTGPNAATDSKSSQRITIRTDVFNIEIDTIGADIRQVDLVDYSNSIKDKTPFRLMSDKRGLVYHAETGFVSSKGKAPNHLTEYKTAQQNYELGDQNELKVDFTWQSDDGIKVTKSYIFKREKYVVDVMYTVDNQSGNPWQAVSYWQLVRRHVNDNGSIFLPTFTGAAIYTKEEAYEKISFDEISANKLKNRTELENQVGGWIAMLQHYFVAAWIPAATETSKFYSDFEQSARQYEIGLHSHKISVAPGKQVEFKKQFYAGPKIEKNLEPISKGLELTIDFGWLTIISKPLFWILDWIHGWIGNWGWAIIILTIMIKLAFYKLSEKSYRSMAKMKEIHPRLQALKERHGDNKQAMQEGMMKMYREEKINPLSGCLPILIQIPVFIALYYVLLESVELRQAPFMLWIHDLAIPDPFYILPLIMGGTMLLQHKLNPSPLDPVQQKVMLALPIVFTVFFFFFPAGLVLYWCINNILSITQQWVITKRISGGKPVLQ